ncbi:ribonuclease H-like domain-containing protein [Tanacetum coccineum]
MAIPEDHLAKFHKMTDAKEMWNAIKSRFGGNDESKKIFSKSTQSVRDFIEQEQTRIDNLSFDDLYNNLRVFENDVKGSSASSSNLQNVAFISENTSSTNDVSTAYGVSNTSGHNSKHEQIQQSYSSLASQFQVKFYKKTGRKLQFDAKEPVGFDKTKVECYNCHKTGHFARECRTKEDNKKMDGWNPRNKDGSRTWKKKEESKALVTVDGESVDWTTHSEDDENFAFMASNSSRSDTQYVSNECKESYANLKRQYCSKKQLRMLVSSPPPMTMELFCPDLDIEIDDSQYTYGPRKSQPSESESQTTELDTCDSNTSTEPSELVSEPVVNESYIEFT